MNYKALSDPIFNEGYFWRRSESAFIEVSSAGGLLGQFLPDRSSSHFRTTIIGSFWHEANRISSIISIMALHESGFRLFLSKFLDEILSDWQSCPGYQV